VEVGEQVEILRHAQILVQPEALRHVADRPMCRRCIGRHVLTENEDATLFRAKQAGDQPNECGLAGAIRAHQAGDHARLDCGGKVVQRNMRIRKHMPDGIDDDDRFGHEALGRRIVTGIP
jgi:hypothetical protein